MKTNLFLKIVLFSLVSATIFLFSNCSDSEDDAPPARDQFLGTYSVIETCGDGNDTYEIMIMVSGSSENAVVVYNLWDWEESASATIDGNKITIPSQLLDGITFVGSGTISGNTLTISLTVSNSQASDNCNLICNRK